MKKKMSLVLMVILILTLTINVNAANATCDGVIGSKLMSEIKSIFRMIQIAAPVILLLLTSIDFAKIVFSDNKDGMEKAKNNFLKRAVATMIIFFAPFIIQLVLEFINDSSIRTIEECVNQIK